MWVLYLIMLTTGNEHIVEHYGTKTLCESERERLWLKAVKKYPEHRDDFYMVCRIKGIKDVTIEEKLLTRSDDATNKNRVSVSEKRIG